MKKLLLVDELILHMQNKGVKFEKCSIDDAKIFLTDNNYYMKLASYRSNYNKYPSTSKKNFGKYIDLDFAYLQELSTIDMHLRYLIFQMCLDIEHYLKVRFLNNVENNPNEDGYSIIQIFLAQDRNLGSLKKIQAHKSSDYCKDLIEKYYPYFPAWVFVELISFGELAYLCEFYNKTYHASISNNILLNSVRDMRNACAHSNCLINVLRPGNNNPHQTVKIKVKKIPELGSHTIDKKLSNKCIYDFICLLYAYDEIVSSKPTKKKRFKELDQLFTDRMIRNSDWFKSNNLLTSSYQFVKIIIDNVCATWYY